MFSICSSTYQETDELDVFIRSLIYNASDPSMLEVIITNDEGYEPTARLLVELQREFPQVKVATITKEERITHIQQCIDLYAKDKIFPDDCIKTMNKTLDRYKNGEVNRLWFASGRGYNKSAELASGDILAILPSDFVCFFDATEVYNRSKEVLAMNGVLACHLGWVRLSDSPKLVDMYNHLVEVIAQRNVVEVKRHLSALLDSALSEEQIAKMESSHGARIVDAGLFNDAGGFDERWFFRGMSEEFLNMSIDSKLEAEFGRNSCRDRLRLNNVFVGEQRILKDVTDSNVYLLPDLYSSGKHNEFMREYLYPYLGIIDR